VGIHHEDLDAAIQTYQMLSERWFTHASPTLFNAGTPRPQMSSCFLICMKARWPRARAMFLHADSRLPPPHHQNQVVLANTRACHTHHHWGPLTSTSKASAWARVTHARATNELPSVFTLADGSSCYLLQNDSIEGIYDTLKECAAISKSAGGIGLSIHNIRATVSHACMMT
jgi:ribonucleotide reductase alpha subunit